MKKTNRYDVKPQKNAPEAPSRKMTLSGFQREHDEVERMSIELTSRKVTALTNIRRQIVALESLEEKVKAIVVE